MKVKFFCIVYYLISLPDQYSSSSTSRSGLLLITAFMPPNFSLKFFMNCKLTRPRLQSFFTTLKLGESFNKSLTTRESLNWQGPPSRSLPANPESLHGFCRLFPPIWCIFSSLGFFCASEWRRVVLCQVQVMSLYLTVVGIRQWSHSDIKQRMHW